MSAQDIGEIESKLRGSFISEAVNQVMNTVAGLTMDELTVDKTDCTQQYFAYISGVLFMSGPHNMALVVGMHMDEAYSLVAKISRIEVPELKESHLFDVINELANMISGRLKAQLAQKGYIYANSYPFIVCGNDYLLTHSPKLRSIIKRFKSERLELVIKVIFI